MRHLKLIPILLLPLLLTGSVQHWHGAVARKNAGGGDSGPGTTNLKHWWALESDGSDSHGSATATGFGSPSYVSAKVSNGAHLDGSSGNFQITESDVNMDEWSEFSMCAWVKHDTNSSNGDIMGWWDYSAGNKSWLVVYRGASSNDFFFEMWNASGGANANGGTTSTDWIFVVVTYDGSTMRLYVNNSEVDTASYTYGITAQTSENITIGTQADASNYFDGILDEISLWDTELSTDDITWLYNSGSGRAYADL